MDKPLKLSFPARPVWPVKPLPADFHRRKAIHAFLLDSRQYCRAKVRNKFRSIPSLDGRDRGGCQPVNRRPHLTSPLEGEERGKDLGRALLAARAKAGHGGNGHFVLWRNAEYEPAASSRNNPIIPFQPFKAGGIFEDQQRIGLPLKKRDRSE